VYIGVASTESKMNSMKVNARMKAIKILLALEIESLNRVGKLWLFELTVSNYSY
jgi:hypothetical protein